MADLKITELADASSPTGTELAEIVQGGVNKKVTLQQIADLGPTTTPTLAAVLAQDNSAVGLSITNLADPSTAQDAATKNYVDGVVTTQDLATVVAQGNDTSGVIITGLPAPTNGTDATNKTYVDSVASGSNQLAEYTLLTDAAPIVADCGPVKEPKFYLELSNSRTLDLTDLRTNNADLTYATIFFWIKKKVAGDLVLTLDSEFTNIDIATAATVTAYTLSGADESDFFLTAVVRGLPSGCILAWNLVTDVTGGGGGGAVDSVNGQTGTVVLTATNIGSSATGTIAATNVQAAIAELDGDVQAHISDSTAAHAAAAIGFTATGNIAATNVQSALAELDTEKLALTGGTMSGAIAMGTNKITGLAAATANGDALRFEQLPAKVIQFACSDETTSIGAGTNKIQFTKVSLTGQLDSPHTIKFAATYNYQLDDQSSIYLTTL